MNTQANICTPDISTNPLLPTFLVSVRQRFKNEVNRLTSGAMQQMLGEVEDSEDLAFFMSYVTIHRWLRYHVHENYIEAVLESFRGPRFGFLMDLLLQAQQRDFVEGYIRHWQAQDSGPTQQHQIMRLLARHNNDAQALADYVMARWNGLGLYQNEYMIDFKRVGAEERQRYNTMLDDNDRERLQLIDDIADGDLAKAFHYAKLGIIPAMGCPQTCRHCMFTWRPPKPKNEDPQQIYQWADSLTDSVLFTGGDLSNHLQHFYDAIAQMRHVKNFAILLNGDFADDRQKTREVFDKISSAIKSRPRKWHAARVLLQISFDEFHQEVYVDKKGQLAERIPVSKIANIVELYPHYSDEVQLALLHKQTSLNFSHDIFNKGVFQRLATELSQRGLQVQVLDMQASARLKHNPLDASSPAKLLKDATFVLDKFPQAPILLTSSTIDGYGRAALLDEWETVKEKDLLQQVLNDTAPQGESFDVDMMFWFNGWVTLFNAVHVTLGDLYSDGLETILRRHRKDPLLKALQQFDRRLLDIYSEVRNDLEQKIEQATGPHHLFHSLTEESAVRLHMTRRLLQ